MHSFKKNQIIKFICSISNLESNRISRALSINSILELNRNTKKKKIFPSNNRKRKFNYKEIRRYKSENSLFTLLLLPNKCQKQHEQKESRFQVTFGSSKIHYRKYSSSM